MFGKRLRELRETRNLSMDKMIEMYNEKYNAKMNKSTLSRYENGLQNPIYTVVKNLADFFDVPVDYLSGSNDISKKVPLVDEILDFLDPTEIGRRIKEQRINNELTQEQLANDLGFNKSTIQRYETGQVDKIKIPVLQQIAKSLNVNPDWLACKTDTKTEYPSYSLFTNHTTDSASWIIGYEPDESSVVSDIKAALIMQNIDNAIKYQEANTYTIHGSEGKGTVVKSNIPKDKYLLVGEGDIFELTKKEYGALKGVLDAMSSSFDDE